MIKKLLLSIALASLAWSQVSVAQSKTEQEKMMCKYSADHMIEIAKQSLKEKSSRPERIEKRRKLVEDWVKRMEEGENPCSVYADITKEANTF